MKKLILFLLLPLWMGTVSAQTSYYVSPTGLAGNSGTSFANAKSLLSALAIASAGDSVILKSGTYNIPYSAGNKNTISLSQSGTASAYITVCSEPNTISTIDFQFPNYAWVQDSYGLHVTGDYWKFKNLIITRAGYQGVYVEGGYNIFDYCVFYDNRNTGMEINKGGHHTTLLNCDAYFNYDPKKGGSMADGYAIKQLQGAGNTLIGCRAWDNSDDAYDTFDSPEAVVFRECWAFNNGIDLWNDPNIAFSGNGNGFKVGGLSALQNNILSHCVAFGNPKKGFDQNNNNGGITVYNCISYKNSINYGMGGVLASGEKHIFKNCISLSGTNSDSYGTSTQSNNSWNSGFSVSSSDFLSLDLSLADDARSIDGSLPNNNLFRLKTSSSLVDAGVNVGLAYNGSAPDLGAFETGSAPGLNLTSGSASQTVNIGSAIASIVYTWSGTATGVTISGLPAGLSGNTNTSAKTYTITGTPTANGTYTLTTTQSSGTAVSLSGTITRKLNTPTGVSASASGTDISVNWSAVTEATGYVINLCSTKTGVLNEWDFTGAWSIGLADADANLVEDATAGRFNYIPPTTNAALKFANGNAIPDVLDLLFTQGGSTALRLGYNLGKLYLNGTGISVSIPCASGNKVTISAMAGNATATNRGFSVSGGTLNTSEKSSNVNTSGILTEAAGTGTWVYDATSSNIVITSVAGGMNILKISVSGTGSICDEYIVSGGSSNSKTITGLDPSTVYYYQVKATNATTTATSNYSTADNVTTGTGVTPSNASISLTSAASTDNQSVTVNTAITNIAYSYAGSFNSIEWTNTSNSNTPPTNITVNTATAGLITISGSPSEVGTYDFTLNIDGLNGGTSTSATGNITSIALAPTLSTPTNKDQTITVGDAITNIIYTWGGGATDANATNLPAGLTATKDATAKTLTISGSTTATSTYTVTTTGGTGIVKSISGTITVNPLAPTLTTPTNKDQTITVGDAITNIIYTWGDGATDANATNLPAGLTATKDATAKTLTISGSATTSGTYTVTTTGGYGSDRTTNGTITVNAAPITCITTATAKITNLSSTGTYTLNLYDASGNTLIKTLGKGEFLAGDSDFQFSPSGIPAGTYSYKLLSGASVIKTGSIVIP